MTPGSCLFVSSGMVSHALFETDCPHRSEDEMFYWLFTNFMPPSLFFYGLRGNEFLLFLKVFSVH
jgi:hypothetical protein